MYRIIAKQYELVKSARGALFEYCETIKPKDLQKKLPSYNQESMLTLLVHTANCYLFWINCAMQEGRAEFQNADFTTVRAIREMYEQVNDMMETFLEHFKESLEAPRLISRPDGTQLTRNPFEVFTHVIMHEFHHKGQLVNMSRQMGYQPADTDVIRE